MLVSSTPETASPVSDACELNEVPCISTVAPWQPWLFGRGGKLRSGFGFGDYMLVIMGNKLGVNPCIAVPIVALLTAAIAWPASRIAFRLQDGYFAIGTWVIAEVFGLSFANASAIGGGSGASLTALQNIEKATRESVTFWMTLVAVAATIGLTYWFLRGKQGLALLAIRDSEIASQSGESMYVPPSRRSISPLPSAPDWQVRCTSSATCASRRMRASR